MRIFDRCHEVDPSRALPLVGLTTYTLDTRALGGSNPPRLRPLSTLPSLSELHALSIEMFLEGGGWGRRTVVCRSRITGSLNFSSSPCLDLGRRSGCTDKKTDPRSEKFADDLWSLMLSPRPPKGPVKSPCSLSIIYQGWQTVSGEGVD